MKKRPCICFLTLCILAALALVPALFRSGLWAICITLNLVLVGIAIYANLRVDCSWFGPVLTRFRPTRKQVWLTIDDGPDPCFTPQTLRLLERFNARATFFLVGQRVERNPELVRRIIAQGHTVGNHSATHRFRSFWAAGPKTAAEEIDGGAAAIAKAVGVIPNWFRAPVGLANCFVRAALSERNMALIAWSARGLDGVPTTREKTLARIFSTIRPGAIVLLHEGSSVGRQFRDNQPILEAVLRRLTDEGYSCIVPDAKQLVAENEGRAKWNPFVTRSRESMGLHRT